VALELGVRIHEGTRVTKLDRRSPAVLHTPRGVVTADRVVIATNAWAVGLRELHTRLAIISSDIVATAPMPDRLQEIGWTRHECISDSRLMISYYRTTDDGRIVFGKGGWGIALGDRIGPRFDRDEGRARQVAHSLHEIYPMLADVPIATDWCGPIDRTRTGLPIFGHLGGRSHIIYGVGFSHPLVAGARHRRRMERLRPGRRPAGPLPARPRALPGCPRGARGRSPQGRSRDGRPRAQPPGSRPGKPGARGDDPEEVGVAHGVALALPVRPRPNGTRRECHLGARRRPSAPGQPARPRIAGALATPTRLIS
jgi:hypothetical protein